MKILRVLTATALATLVLAGTTACTATVSLQPAELSNDPNCAEVSVRLPETIGTAPKRTTDAQATAAYGNPTAVIVRCGLPEVKVSKLRCVSTSDVDWLVDPSDAPRYRFISFGRKPATEVIIDSTKAVGVSTLDALAPAIKSVAADATCSG